MSSSSQRFAVKPIKISTIILRVPDNDKYNFSHVKVLIDPETGSIPSFMCRAPQKWYGEATKFVNSLLPGSAQFVKYLGVADDLRDQPFSKSLITRDTYLVFSIPDNRLRERHANWVYSSRLVPDTYDYSKVLTDPNDFAYWSAHQNHIMKRLGLHGHDIL